MKNSLLVNRREFMRMGINGAGLFATGGLFGLQNVAFGNITLAPFASLANIGDLLPPDNNGIRLPKGFTSKIVARSSHQATPNSNYRWHPAPDGGACFATEDGGWIYVSNSELYYRKGGVGALRFSAKGELTDAYPILGNTNLNCAGGKTPWRTWLSCEEYPRGQVYECDPLGNKSAKVLPALGTFVHEAVAADTLNEHLYLTEDAPNGGFYRFRPENGFPDLSVGTLEIAMVFQTGAISSVEWTPVPDPLAKEMPTRMQVKSYTPFRGGEGIAFHDNRIYFTTKLDNRVWCYDVVSHQIDVIYDMASSPNPILQGVDNVVISPSGDVLVAEDGGDMQIVILTPDRKTIPLLQIMGHRGSEICGPAFDPSYERLYFSSQRGSDGRHESGITYEISGPGRV